MNRKSPLGFPAKLFGLQVGWIFLLLIAHLVTQSRSVLLGQSIETGQGLSQLFNLDNEVNLPAWYSSCALFLCALLLGLIAAAPTRNGHEKSRYGWLGLSLIFFFLSLDEAISIHEGLIPGLLSRLDNLPFMANYDWTIFGGLFVVVVAAGYFRFWLRLPSATRLLFAVAMVVFVAGAIGFEKVSHFYEAKYQTENTIAYVVTCGIEEFLEMIGVALFTYGLLAHITQHVAGRLNLPLSVSNIN
ncbi:MAG: hypothetical protein AAGE59_06545 [Cyanobacteria bacterium P01_F01_bin.86]